MRFLPINAAARAAAFVVLVALTSRTTPLAAQATPDRGAAALGSTLAGLGTTGRVLTIAAHPDDEDTFFLAWLARGRHVQTAYLSLTRGDGGQNLIGGELGEALGAIRTQELLAARRIDGPTQYFTRAFDFGFSKNAEETYTHWPKDTILGDVVKVVRAFRPHVIVAWFSGTPRDGHGHHQVSGLLAREAYDLASDTVRFPVKDFGLPWTVSKFYRSARQQMDSATLRVNVGEYDPALGRSYYEIAADSRSQHRSQGQGTMQRKGTILAGVTREAARVGPADARSEHGLFDGVDTTWTSLRAQLPAPVASTLDSALTVVRALGAEYRPSAPAALVPPLARALEQLRRVRSASGTSPARLFFARAGLPPQLSSRARNADPALWDALTTTIQRTEQALILASGVVVEAEADQETYPVRRPEKSNVSDSLPVRITVYNRGALPVTLSNGVTREEFRQLGVVEDKHELQPDSAVTLHRFAFAFEPTTTWWRTNGRKQGDWFQTPIEGADEATELERTATSARAVLTIGGASVDITVPVVRRVVDAVKGDGAKPVAAVPGIVIGLANVMEYIRAGVPVVRDVPVRLESAYDHEAKVTVKLDNSAGLTPDSSEKTVTLAPRGTAVVTFRLRGTVKPGRQQIVAMAFHDSTMSSSGYYTVDYEHISPMRLYGGSGMYLSAVDVKLPPRARVGYIAGLADHGADALEQLDIAVERIDPNALSSMDLSRFTSIMVGPRAYEGSEALVRNNGRLLDYAKAGGTLVVQYGAQNMNNFSKVLPYPLQWAPRAERVTDENAPVKLLAPTNALLGAPNKLTTADWADWVQERATYMPSTIDPRYTSVLGMNDPNEPENKGALLVAPVGKGKYVYVTLALFRQLPNGVPGAARLLANLIAGQPPVVPPRMQ